MVTQSIEWEDVAKNEVSLSRLYRPTIEKRRSMSTLANIIRESVYTPKIEWYWKCLFRSYFYRVLGYSFSIVSIAYLCIRIFNYYYLSAHHQTDEYSLIFCGMLLCRLAPPLCLNYLGLIQLDSHITHITKKETAFTQIMGHLDVISFIGDIFN
ncbi:unnamed protein product, partial [Medioppia subpectinata]